MSGDSRSLNTGAWEMLDSRLHSQVPPVPPLSAASISSIGCSQSLQLEVSPPCSTP